MSRLLIVGRQWAYHNIAFDVPRIVLREYKALSVATKQTEFHLTAALELTVNCTVCELLPLVLLNKSTRTDLRRDITNINTIEPSERD